MISTGQECFYNFFCCWKALNYWNTKEGAFIRYIYLKTHHFQDVWNYLFQSSKHWGLLERSFYQKKPCKEQTSRSSWRKMFSLSDPILTFSSRLVMRPSKVASVHPGWLRKTQIFIKQLPLGTSWWLYTTNPKMSSSRLSHLQTSILSFNFY